MRDVHVFRAQGVLCRDEVEPVTIHIRAEMPDLPAEQSRPFHAAEGAALARAIWASCPGGTVDALIAALLAKRASLLRVPFSNPEEKADSNA